MVEGEVDLRTVLERHAEGDVQVVAPADPVMLEHRVAEELSAAVREVPWTTCAGTPGTGPAPGC